MSYEDLFEKSKYEEILNIASTVHPTDGIDGINATLWKGKVLWAKGELDLALDVLNEDVNLFFKLDTECQQSHFGILADIYNAIANCYIYQNNLQKVFPYYEKVLSIYRGLGDEQKVARTLNNIAVYYHSRGDYRTCLEYLLQTLELYNQQENDYGLLGVYYNLAAIYIELGEIEKSLKYLDAGKVLAVKVDNLTYLGAIHSLYGLKERYEGDFEESHKSFLKALEYYIQLENSRFLALNYSYLIDILLRRNIKSEAMKYLSKLEEIYDTDSTEKIEVYLKLSKARILHHSHRLSDKGKATILYYEILEDGVMNDQMDAIEGLIDLLLDELLISNNEETVTELSSLLSKYATIVDAQHLYSRKISFLVFNSRMEIVKGNLKKAEQLLDEAHNLANEKGMHELKQWVNDRIKEFELQFENWKEIVDKYSDLAKRLETTRVKDYVDFLSMLTQK